MRRLLVLAMSLAITAAGCSDSTAPQNALSGNYTLRSIQGVQTSPWVIYQEPSFKEEVLSSTIAIDANGNFTTTTQLRDTYTGSPSTTYTDQYYGYWTLSGDQVSLTDTSGPTPYTYYGTVSGNTITVSSPSVGVQVYSK